MPSKPTSKKFIESLAANPSKIRKITLATLIVAVSLSVAIEIGYATSLAQGYTSSADSYKQTVCVTADKWLRSACVPASACLHYKQTDTLSIITNKRPSFCTCYIQNVPEVPVQNQRMLDIPHICEIQ